MTDDFDLPHALRDENISRARRELITLLYHHPNQRTRWYTDTMDVDQAYISGFDSKYPGIIESEKEADYVETGSVPLHRRLTDAARRAFLDDGVIDDDPLADFANEAEEPGQKTERGNMTFVGAIDATTPPEQSIRERPVKSNVNDDDAPESAEGSSTPGEKEPESDDWSVPYVIALNRDELFTLLRTADEDVARTVFEQVHDE